MTLHYMSYRVPFLPKERLSRGNGKGHAVAVVWSQAKASKERREAAGLDQKAWEMGDRQLVWEFLKIRGTNIDPK